MRYLSVQRLSAWWILWMTVTAMMLSLWAHAENQDLMEPKTLSQPEAEKTVKIVLDRGVARGEFLLNGTKVVLMLPEDIRTGDTVTGKIAVDPEGPPLPVGSFVEIQGVKADLSKPMITFKLPFSEKPLIMNAYLKDATGSTLQTIAFYASPATTSPVDTLQGAVGPIAKKATIPGRIHPEVPIVIEGSFDGVSANTVAKVDAEKAEILTESPRQLVIMNPSTVMGIRQITVREGEMVYSHLSHNVPETYPTIIPKPCLAELDKYKAELYQTIDEGWQPPKPQQPGVYTTTVRYRLTRRGQVVRDVQLVKSSGYTPMDESAVARVQTIQKEFKAFPACYQFKVMEIDHTFKAVSQ